MTGQCLEQRAPQQPRGSAARAPNRSAARQPNRTVINCPAGDRPRTNPRRPSRSRSLCEKCIPLLYHGSCSRSVPARRAASARGGSERVRHASGCQRGCREPHEKRTVEGRPERRPQGSYGRGSGRSTSPSLIQLVQTVYHCSHACFAAARSPELARGRVWAPCPRRQATRCRTTPKQRLLTLTPPYHLFQPLGAPCAELGAQFAAPRAQTRRGGLRYSNRRTSCSEA